MSFFPFHSGWGHGHGHHGHGGGIVNNLVVNVSEREHYRHRYYDDNWYGPWRGPCNHWNDNRGGGNGGQGNGGGGNGNGGGGNGGGRD